jgi:hypothetical protein
MDNKNMLGLDPEIGKILSNNVTNAKEIVFKTTDVIGSSGKWIFENLGKGFAYIIDTAGSTTDSLLKNGHFFFWFVTFLAVMFFIVGLFGFILKNDFWYYLIDLFEQLFGSKQETIDGDESKQNKKPRYELNISGGGTSFATNSRNFNGIFGGLGSFSSKGTLTHYLNNNEPFASGMSYVNMISNFVSSKPTYTIDRNKINSQRSDGISIMENKENKYYTVYKPVNIKWKLNESEHPDFQNLPETIKQHYRKSQSYEQDISWTYINDNNHWTLNCPSDMMEINGGNKCKFNSHTAEYIQLES